MTLGDATRVFLTKPTARILVAVTAAVLVVRVALGRWTLRDVVVMAAIIGFEPLTEWVIHVYVLHMKPRMVGRWRLDPLVAMKHRAHHRDPADLDLVFIPQVVVAVALVVGFGLPLLLAPTARVALSASVASFGMLLTYEWTHYLIHTRYRPKSDAYKRLWRAHRLHHFRNENYWFGVTSHLGDRVLGTYPDKDEVDLSPTARDLDDART
ncbi:MAG TPA: sterol desaturase family protein [Acidimicrobiales bacterium]|jgi:sterol desaturase/sphingolipid hydroxylase (fatty acid hydroxylase superfamily)